jgi:hypothetical protein
MVGSARQMVSAGNLYGFAFAVNAEEDSADKAQQRLFIVFSPNGILRLYHN